MRKLRKEWTAADSRALRNLAGKHSDASIARITGHCERTVRDNRNAMQLPAYASRPSWTRRDWLLNSAAGLDFDIPSCPI